MDAGRLLGRQMVPDGELLRRFVDEKSDEAFTLLVQRHMKLVYAGALRRAGGDAHAADDIAQRVFLDLARKAPKLRSHASLAGWLHTATRFAAAQFVRSEQRRRVHERDAAQPEDAVDEPWAGVPQIDSVFDEVLDLLDEHERDAVVMHFIEGRTFGEVGSLLSVTADAARMRVRRALGKLRAGLERRGITSPGAALAGVLSLRSRETAAAQPQHLVAKAVAAARVAKPLPPLAWRWAIIGGGAGLAGILGVSVFLAKRWETAPPSDAAAAVAPAAARSPSNEEPQVLSGGSPAVRGAAARTGPSTSATLGGYSPTASHYLARLWALHEAPPPEGGGSLVLVVRWPGPGRPPYVPLIRDHLVHITGRQQAGGVRLALTAQGLAYCQEHRAELEAIR